MWLDDVDKWIKLKLTHGKRADVAYDMVDDVTSGYMYLLLQHGRIM